MVISPDGHLASSLAADQEASASQKSSADCRDEVSKDVEEFEMSDVDCDHIDVDTVDDSTPLSAAAAGDDDVDTLITSSLGKHQ